MKTRLALILSAILFSSLAWNPSLAIEATAVVNDPGYESRQTVDPAPSYFSQGFSSPDKAAAAMGARAGARGTTVDWTLGLVGAGGAIGASSRYLATQWAGTVDWFGYELPIGTLMVNVLGSLGIGVMTGWAAASQDIHPAWPALITVGFLGGLTTFSTFAQETVNLSQHAGLIASASYIGVSVATSIAAVLMGQQLGIWLAPMVLF